MYIVTPPDVSCIEGLWNDQSGYILLHSESDQCVTLCWYILEVLHEIKQLSKICVNVNVVLFKLVFSVLAVIHAVYSSTLIRELLNDKTCVITKTPRGTRSTLPHQMSHILGISVFWSESDQSLTWNKQHHKQMSESCVNVIMSHCMLHPSSPPPSSPSVRLFVSNL